MTLFSDKSNNGHLQRENKLSSAQTNPRGVWVWLLAYPDNLVKTSQLLIWAYPENLVKI